MSSETPAAVTDGTPGVARYRRKVAEADAIQWTGGNLEAVRAFVADDNAVEFRNDAVLHILTYGGWKAIWPGSWIGRENGRLLFCATKETFALNYEPADAAPSVAAALDRDAVAAVLRKQLGTADFQAREVAGQICALMGGGSDGD